MSATELLSVGLVAFGVAVELGCCLGVLVMHDVYDKLHYTGPAAILGPVAFAGGILLTEGLTQSGIKAVLVAVLLIIANPVLTHATGRAFYIRQRDHVEPLTSDPRGASEP